MAYNANFVPTTRRAKFRQSGAILIVMVFILGLGVAAYMIKAMNATASQYNQNERALLILGEAKAALIGYTLSRTGTGERPGDMPRPDYFASSEMPSNYDGQADGGCLNASSVNGLPLISSGTNMRCLGRLPWKTIGLSTLAASESDTLGTMPWYAVSANLVDPTCMSVINSGILNILYTAYVCGSTTNLPHPWLTVRDNLGNIISNRVAVVLMLPKPTINGQSRPNSPLGGLTNYLEDENSDFDNEFVQSSADATLNDVLVFITIDELMTAIEKRVGEQVRSSLKTYQDANGYYPYAAQLGTTKNFGGEESLLSGYLPVDYQSCTYTRVSNTSNNLTCQQPIFDSSNPDDNDTSGIGDIQFTSSSPSFLNDSGSCVHSSNRCNCSGDGSCYIDLGGILGGINFTCTDKICSTTSSGLLGIFSADGTYLVSDGKFTSRTGACTQTTPVSKTNECTNNNTSRISCSSSAGGTFSSNSDVRFDNILPTWFEENMWQSYVYYLHTRPVSNTITAGAKNADAIAVTVGRMVDTAPFTSKGSAQNRSNPVTQCSQLNEYLDSAENISLNSIYESSDKQKTLNYNDQIFLVQP